MEAAIELLRANPLCEGIDDADLARMAGSLTPMHVPTGEYLARVGDAFDNVYILATGRMKVTVPAANHADHELMYFNPGDFIGHYGILDTGISPANVIAVRPSDVLVMPGKEFLECFATIPRLALNLVRALNGRVRQIIGLQKSEGFGKTVCAVHSGPIGRQLLALIKKELTGKGERVGVFGAGGASSSASERFDQWDQMTRSHHRVFLEVALDSPPEIWLDVARRCRQVLLLIEPARESDMQRAMARLREQAPELADRVLVVWVLPEGNMVAAPSSPFWNHGRRHFLVTMSSHPEAPTRLQQQGVDRIVRRLRGISLGLALAGGGARGMAHLGVLRALEREGINFDLLAGTSSGAMVGINYAAGYSPDFCIEAFQRDLKPADLWSLIPKGPNWHLLWKFRTRAWEEMLRRYLHDWKLEQLPIPFHAVTVDLVSSREIIRESGDAVNAILESINLPGMAAPINRDGMCLVDGGILNNMPADVLAGRGADLVVAVSVSRKVRTEFAGNRPTMPTEQMRKAGTFETLFRVFETQAHGMDRVHTQPVDVLIEPDTSAFSFIDFTRASEMAEVGEAATASALPGLKERIAALEHRASMQSAQAQEEFVIKPVLETVRAG